MIRGGKGQSLKRKGGEIMKRIIGALTMLGTLGFVAAIVQKVTYSPNVLGLVPTSYLKFSAICLLLSIALSARELAFKSK